MLDHVPGCPGSPPLDYRRESRIEIDSGRAVIGHRRGLGPWAGRRAPSSDPSDQAEVRQIVATAAINQASRGGRGAGDNFVAATRCVYRFAEGRWISAADNPARNLKQPARRRARRFAIPAQHVAEICHVVATSGTDLDSLILQLVNETACRRAGALALRPCDLDPDQCLVFLREKSDSDRWRPVSPALIQYLLDHAEERGSPASGQLLRYRDGGPITSRHFDNLWRRVGPELPWAAAQGISTHWLRHTTLTWVERNFSYAVARAYAGHHDKAHGVTATYVKADFTDLACALSVLTGEPHPLGTDRRATIRSTELPQRP